MKNKLRRSMRYGLLLLFVAVPRTGLADVGELLAQLNRKPAEERQQLLLENAKKEGGLTLYTATNVRDTQEVVNGFTKHYPFLKLNFLSLGGPGVLNKITTEYRAGVNNADVVVLTGNNALELIDKKIVAVYRSPMIAFVRKGLWTRRDIGPASTRSGIQSFIIRRESLPERSRGSTKSC